MKTIYRFVLKYIKAYPANFFKTAMICFICSIFLTGQFIVIYSYIHTSEIKKENEYGIYDYIIVSENETLLENISSSSEVEKYGKLIVYNIGKNTTFRDKCFLIGTADENALNINKIHILNGRMPEEKNEIALERSTLAIFYPNASIGDKINVLIDDKQTELVLSAVLSDYSKKQWQNEDNEYSLPNAFISKKAVDTAYRNPMFTFISVKIPTKQNAGSFLRMLENQNENLRVQDNHKSEASISSFWGIDEKLFGVISIVSTFTISLFLMFNLAASKKVNDETRIGLLKLIGFSSSDLLKYHMFKTFLEVIPAVILGSFFGMSIALIILHRIEAFEHSVRYDFILLFVIFIAILLCFILFYGLKRRINETVCSNLNNYAKTQSITKKSNFHSSNPVLLYSVKSYNLRPDVSTTAALMILLSIIVLYIGLFSSSSIRYTSEHSVPCDYTARIYDGSYDKTSYIPLNPYVGLSQNEFNLLEECDEVERIIPIKSISMFSTNRENIVNMTANDKKHYGFSEKDNLYPISLVGTDYKNIKEIVKKYCKKNNVDLSKLRDGKHVIAFNRGEDIFKTGEIVNLTQALISETSVKTVNFSVTVLASIDEDDFNEMSIEHYALMGTTLLWDESSFELNDIPLKYKELYIDILDPEKTVKIDSILYEIADAYKDSANVQLTRNLEERIQLETIADSFEWVSKIGATAFVLVSISSMVININIRSKQRKKIIGALRACGLTIKDYIRIAIVENAIESGIPIIIGNIIAITCCKILNNSIFSVPLTNMPIRIMLIFSILYLLLSILVSVISASKFFRISISQCIREKE